MNTISDRAVLCFISICAKYLCTKLWSLGKLLSCFLNSFKCSQQTLCTQTQWLGCVKYGKWVKPFNPTLQET